MKVAETIDKKALSRRIKKCRERCKGSNFAKNK
jgi:hypothetical protein